MNLLLDTHVLLWAAGETKRLSRKARQLLSDDANSLYFSSASFWEISIKLGLGRPDFKVNPRLLLRGLLDNGWRELPANAAHTLHLERLPLLHKDPFDRILVAQAEAEGLVLVTADVSIAKYRGSVLLV